MVPCARFGEKLNLLLYFFNQGHLRWFHSWFLYQNLISEKLCSLKYKSWACSSTTLLRIWYLYLCLVNVVCSWFDFLYLEVTLWFVRACLKGLTVRRVVESCGLKVWTPLSTTPLNFGTSYHQIIHSDLKFRVGAPWRGPNIFKYQEKRKPSEWLLSKFESL